MKKILVLGLVGESVFLGCDHFHNKGETIVCDSMYTEIGGKGFNQALAIHTLGGNVKFISCIGNDTYGDICSKETLKLGLEHKYYKSEKNTSFATILTDKSGSNEVSVYRGSTLEKEHLLDIYKEVDQIDILLIQFEMNIDVVKDIIRYAKKKNKFIVLNPAPAVELFDEVLMCDLIIPNENEVEILFGNNYIEKIKEKNITTIVTLGDKGSLLIDQNNVIEIKPEKVDSVDTTGAGDVFCASITYMLSKGEKLLDAIKFATKMASITVQYHYVIPSILKIKSL